MTPEELNQKVAALTANFEATFTKYEKQIPLTHRVIKECLSDQVEIQLAFERLQAKSAYLEKMGEAMKEQYHAHAYVTVISKSNKTLTPTDAKKHADCETDYIQAVKAYNGAYKLNKEIDAVVNVMEARRYLLKDHSATVVAGANGHIL